MGRDFFDVSASEIRTQIGPEVVGAKRGGNVLLFTERGYGKIVKGWNRDVTWFKCQRFPPPSTPQAKASMRFSPHKTEAEMSSPNHQSRERVPVTLAGGRVLQEFRDGLFSAANRAGMSPNEFALRAVAEKLTSRGQELPGIFEVGDIEELRI